MICTCSGHPNEPDPCPACLTDEYRWVRERAKLDAGEYDQELGEYARAHEKHGRCASFLIEDFLNSRLEAAIPCPEEEG